MKRKHLAYTIPTDVIEATKTYMDAKPWRDEREDEETFMSLSQTWTDSVSALYEVPPVTLVRSSFADGYEPAESSDFDEDDEEEEEGADGFNPATIRIARDSMMRLFTSYGAHLALQGKLNESLDSDSEAQSWGYSVFYRANPKLFRKNVREGRIQLDPYLIYTSQTEQALRDYDIDPTDPRALTLLAETQREAIADAMEGAEDEDELARMSEPVSETSEGNVPDVGPMVSPEDRYGVSTNELRAMNTRQLRVFATGIGMTGTWSMTKPALLAALGVQEAAEVR